MTKYVASGAVEAARASLEAHETNGTRVPRMVGFKGTARQHTKTVEEMAAASTSLKGQADELMRAVAVFEHTER